MFRERRVGAAWFVVYSHDVARIGIVKAELATDPYAGDLKLAYANLLLNAGDKDDYNAEMTQLQELTPQVKYQIITITPR